MKLTQLVARPQKMKTQSQSQSGNREFLKVRITAILAMLMAVPALFAANGTWSNAPVSGVWTNVLNWNGGTVPGTINNTANNGVDGTSIANFTNAITTYGGAANPVIPDDATVVNGKARMMSQLNFSGPNCGAYVFSSPSPYAAQTSTTPETGVLSLCVGSGTPNGSTIDPLVTNPQNFLVPVQIRLPSSTTGTYGFTNNATSSLATYYFNNLFLYPGGTTRALNFVFAGSNTGTNTVAYLSQGVNLSTATDSVLKQGTGRWIFSGANTFKAGTPFNIFGGTLEVQNASAFGLSSSAVVNNATLQIDGVSLASLSIGLQTGGNIQMNGSGTLNAVVLGTAAASSMTLATTSASDISTVSAMSGGAVDGVVHVAGPGTVVLPNNNFGTNGAWSTDGGTNQLTTTTSLGQSAKYLAFGAASTGVLQLNGNSITALALTSNPTAGTPGVINGNANPATLTVNNGTANTFAGSLTDGAGGGALSLTKGGLGTLTLSGASTYTGNTTISLGALNLTGSLVNSAVTVASGATLAGAGSVGNSVTVQSGGVLDPGTAGIAGKLTAGSLTLNSGSSSSFEFDTIASTNDQMIVSTSGGLTINGGAISLFLTNGNNFAAAGTYKLMQYTGAIGGSGVSSLTIGNAQPGYAYAFGTSSGYVTVTITSAGVNTAWSVDANGTWSDTTKWTGGIVPNSAGAAATLGAGTVLRTVTLSAPATVGGISFTNSNSFVVTGSSPLTLANSGSGISLSAIAGTVNAISTPVVLNGNLTASVSAGKSLAFSGAVSSSSAQTVTVNGAGTVSLSGVNTYGPASGTVGTTLNGGGVLNVGNNSALSTGDLDFTGSSTLKSGLSGLTLANYVIIDSVANATVDNNGNPVSLNGNISGGGTLVANGTGTLTLGGANSYTGPTTVNGGTLAISTDAGLGTVPGAEVQNVILNGGTLLGTSSFLVNSTRDIGVGLSAGSVGTNANISATSGSVFNFSGVIASAGNTGMNGLNVNTGTGNIGTVVLSGANTFSGPTYIAQGALQVANALALQNSVLDYTNGTLLFDGSTTAATIAEIVGSQSLALTNLSGAGVTLTLGGDNGSVTNVGNLTDAGLISGVGAFIKNGTGTLALAGTNKFTGDLRSATGILQIATNGLTVAGTVTVQGSSTPQLQVNGGALVATNLTLSTSGSVGAGNVYINSGTVSLSGTISINAASSEVSTSDGIYVNTNATLYASYLTTGRGALSATTQPTAGQAGQSLIVNGGTVVITNNLLMGPVGANSGTSMSVNSGSLTVDGTLTFGCNNGGRWSVVDVAGGTMTVNDTVTGIDIGGPYAGAGQVLLVRGGTVNANIITLGNGTNSGTSAINITSGSLYLGAGGIVQVSSNAASSITLNGGVLGASANWTATNPMTLGGGTIQTADSLGAAHNITLSGSLGGTGFTNTGSGKLTLSAGNYFTGGAVLNSGTLNINGSWALGGAFYGGLTFNGGTLQYAPAFSGNGPGDISENTAATPVPQAVTFNSNATIDLNGNAVTYAYGVGNGGAGGLIINSTLSGGLLNLLGTNTYKGNTTVNSNSTLELSLPTIPTNSTVTVNTGGLLKLDFAGTNVVTNIVLGASIKLPGTYNSVNSPSFITGTGSLQILSTSTIANYSTNITATVTGGGTGITVAWPTTHLGWELAVQTNSLATGLANNWVTNAGTASVTSTNYPINPANGSVFFRLVHP